MADEIVDGKRTLIARAGHADFELPQGHEIDVGRDNDGNVTTATLRWRGHASAFLASMEERRDEVVIRLNTRIGSTGYATTGGELPPSPPYPFPDEPAAR